MPNPEEAGSIRMKPDEMPETAQNEGFDGDVRSAGWTV